ncbi:MAG: bifunctional 2-polyprenyl-6-hydroxyphenol methylase/3-demethylubiquinol 3-O-methyltransferase UbiG [Betaproteobacteria bacterium]|nr:bifunctional 2-polyprenyl-6-hydroxyphenol methylase/3-demethylubiquinol 3-O-methyltransferase UbiG [Betaproteobacteria bacterium]
MNADQTELQKFNALAKKWWQPDGAFRPLHELNPIRLQWIESITSLEGKKILDIGCGGGILSEGMARRGAQVTGIDLASEAIQTAKAHAAQSGLSIDYRLISAEDLAKTEPDAYDIITCLETLEHVPEPLSLIQAASRLVKPKGTVFFATLNRNLKSFVHAIVAAEYMLGLLPRGTHHYARFLTPAELSRSIRHTGMTISALTGIHYTPITKRFHLTRDVSVNYMIACQRPL